MAATNNSGPSPSPSSPKPKWWKRLLDAVGIFFAWIGTFLWSKAEPQRYQDSELMRAVEEQDIGTVKKSLEQGANVNQVDGLGKTPLMYAVEKHDIETVRQLLARGANVNYVNEKAKGYDDEADTALGIAIETIRLEAVDLEIVKLLLDHKASIKRTKLTTHTNLSLYTQSVLDYFPSVGIKMFTAKDDKAREKAQRYSELRDKVFNLVANAGSLFLHPDNLYFRVALETGHITTVENTLRFIRQHHVPVEVYQQELNEKEFFSLYGGGSFAHVYMPIPYALHHNQTEMALFLLKNALTDLDEATRKNVLSEALVFACYCNNTPVVEFCLKNGVAEEINHYVHNRMGLTALMAAAYKGNISIIEQLLKNDIDVNHIHIGQLGNQRGYYGMAVGVTALYCALISDQDTQTKEAMVYFLLNNGAKLNSRALKAMVDSGFVLNLEKVPNLIEYLDEPEYDTQPYRQIIDQIKEHNETVRLKMTQAMEVTKMPSPITHMVTEYLLGEKRSSEGSKSSKEAGPSENKPRTRS